MSVLPNERPSKSGHSDSIISTNTLPNLNITADERQEKSKNNLIKLLLQEFIFF